jgi:hypothetical protein
MKKTQKLLGLALATLLSQGVNAAPLQRTEARVEIEGASAIAGHLRRILPRYLAQELAKAPIDAPPGARLVVRVTEVFLSNDLGSDPDGGMMMDALDGEALVLDARGTVLARKRVAGRMPPGGNLMDVNNEPRRVDALAQSLAYWAVRELR